MGDYSADIQVIFNSISKEIEVLSEDLEVFMSKNKIPKIPDYSDILNRETFYTDYAIVAQLSNEYLDISRSYLSISQEVVIFQNKLSMARQDFGVNISLLLDRLKLIDKLLSTYKYCLDTNLRFYQSIQYIMGSPRFQAVY